MYCPPSTYSITVNIVTFKMTVQSTETFALVTQPTPDITECLEELGDNVQFQ